MTTLATSGAGLQRWTDFIVPRIENIRGDHLAGARYRNFGRMIDIVPAAENALAWTGAISIKKRFGDDLTKSEVREQLIPLRLHKYYVQQSPVANTRCIDGRCLYQYDPTKLNKGLGAQVPGGTATAALCARIADLAPLEDDYDPMTDDDALNENTFMQDIHDMQRLLDVIHWKAGGHIDDNAGKGKTGCGAIDNLPAILERITSAYVQEQLRALSRMLLGRIYDEAIVDELLGRFLLLQSQSSTYFARNRLGNYVYLQESIEHLKSEGFVGKLTGKHKEIALLVNMIEDTTFHRDQFSFDNDHRIQVFGYDFWQSIRLARQVSTHERDKTRKISPQQQHQIFDRFLTTRVLFAVATAMVLTDGTLELIVRSKA